MSDLLKNPMGNNSKLWAGDILTSSGRILDEIVDVRLADLIMSNAITQNTTVNLTESIKNYQFIMIIGLDNRNNHYVQSLILPVVSTGQHSLGLSVDASREYKILISNDNNIRFNFPTERTFSIIGGASDAHKITGIYGLFPKT